MVYFTNTEGRFLPIVTDTLYLGGIQLDTPRTATDVVFLETVFTAKFQMMLFGCKYQDDFDQGKVQLLILPKSNQTFSRQMFL